MRTELVATLKRKATELIAGIEADQNPVLITQHGKPAAVLMAVGAFESLQHRLGILEGIARGERALEEGRTISHAEAKKRMAQRPNVTAANPHSVRKFHAASRRKETKAETEARMAKWWEDETSYLAKMTGGSRPKKSAVELVREVRR